jgi:hypothetical protein
MAEETLYVEIVGSAGAAAGGGKPKPEPDPPPSFFKKLGGGVQSGLKTAGISFGMSAILKQSQLFTSYVGTIFQIVGALIDVTLAPLMPIFIPVLKFLTKMLPGARKVGEAVAGAIITVIEWFKSSPVMKGIQEWWDTHTPEWMHMSTDKIAAIAGGIFAVLFLGKFVGLFKLLRLFWRIFVRSDGQLKILGSLFSTLKGKIFKFFDQTLPTKLFDLVGGVANKVNKFSPLIKGWLDEIGIKIFNVGKTISSTLGRWATKALNALHINPGQILKGVGNFFKSAWGNVIKFLSRPISFLTKIGGFVVKGFNFVKGLFGFAKGLVDNVIKTLKGGPMAILKGLVNVLKSVLSAPFKALAKVAGKFGLKGVVDGLTNVFKKGAGSMIGKIGGKAGLKAAGMSIPGFGAAVGLGFGIMETVRMTKEHGMKGMGAGLAYTAAATAGGAMGGPVGLAVAIGSEVALNQFENRVLKVEVAGPDENAKVSMKTQQGKEQMMEVTNTASDFQPGYS